MVVIICGNRTLLSSVSDLLSMSWSPNAQIGIWNTFLVLGEKLDLSYRFETHCQKGRFKVEIYWWFYPQSEKTPGKEEGTSSKDQVNVKSKAGEWHRFDITKILPGREHQLCACPSGQCVLMKNNGGQTWASIFSPNYHCKITKDGSNRRAPLKQ